MLVTFLVFLLLCCHCVCLAVLKNVFVQVRGCNKMLFLANPLFSKVSKVGVFWFACFAFFKCVSRKTLFILWFPRMFRKQVLLKRPWLKIRFWAKVKVRFCTNLGSKRKSILGQDLTFILLIFRDRKKTFYSLCLAKRTTSIKLAQNLTFKMAKLVQNLTSQHLPSDTKLLQTKNYSGLNNLGNYDIHT